MAIELGFHGAAGGVTGSCYLLRTPTRRILVDCGFFQGSQRLEELNAQPFAFDPGDVDLVVLTHAHIDHLGRVPLLPMRGFKGRFVATRATRDMAEVMLADSARIQQSDAQMESRLRAKDGEPPVAPLYTEEDAKRCGPMMDGVPYGETVDLGGGVKLTFHDSGHILGASFVELAVAANGASKRLVFSGDLGNPGKAIIRDPETVPACDVLLVESTYGNRLHKDQASTLDELGSAINKSVLRGGIVIIPAFALGRTQEVLYHLSRLRAAGTLPHVPVYVDSPLAIDATEVFMKHPECFDEEMRQVMARGESPFSYPELHFTRSPDESKKLNEDNAAKVVIAASGMCTSGRVLHHLKHHGWKKNAAIIFCGYQGEGTLGRRIVDGQRKVRIHHEDVTIAAEVHTLGGFSAHADQAGLVHWVGPAAKAGAHVFVTHGEPAAAAELSKVLGDRLSAKCTVPALGDVATL
ncbi:MAG TPA: MBL fold metallo-hydrolase [Myxococcota bacterium]|jgi:metallo-beta-lactamase family protein|nr:MBL fold metallo-hydrolase [Myxococcota bacterium]